MNQIQKSIYGFPFQISMAGSIILRTGYTIPARFPSKFIT